MNKLDEIEARFKDAYGYGGEYQPSPMPLAEAIIDIDLLIRAVRQLGTLYDEEVRRTDKSLSMNLTIESLDPDVLELVVG